jgi:hypothetical protein
MTRARTIATLIGVALAVCSAADSPKPAVLTVEADGQSTRIEGELTKGAPPADLGAQATGRRTYEPIIFRKRVDKTTPLLAKALCNNQVIERLPLAIGEQRYELRNARCKCETSAAIESITIVHEGFQLVK